MRFCLRTVNGESKIFSLHLLMRKSDKLESAYLPTDNNIRHQQNLRDRQIALVVLQHSQWPMVKLVIGNIVPAMNSAQPGSYQEVEVPFKDA